MEDRERRARLFRVAQYLLGALALAWVLSRVEWTRVATLLSDVPPGTIAALVVVSGIGLVAGISLWHVLLNSVRRTRFMTAVNTGLIVLFVNHLLPSRLSGRAVAPLIVHDETGMDYPDAIAVSGVHTGLYALIYGLLSLVGLVIGLDRLPLGLTLVLLLSTTLYVVAGVLVLLAGVHIGTVDRITDGLNAVAGRVPAVGDRLSAITENLPAFTAMTAATFRALITDPVAVLSYAAGCVVVLLIAPGLRIWLLFEALGVGFEPAILLPVYLVTAYSVTLLPLTPGGVGVTEASATAVFIALGVPAGAVVPAIFADRLLGSYLPALLGWYPSLRVDFSGLISE